MKSEAYKNFAIGLFVVVAMGLVVGLLFFLRPSVGDGDLTLHVRFSNIEKVNVGTRVAWAGRPVGEVVGISLISEAREEAQESDSDVYTYELTLAVDSSVRIYDSDEIAIHTSGLMGERSVSIIPRRAYNDKKNPPKMINDEVIYAKSRGSIDETIGQFISLALKAEQTMDHVISLIQTNNEEIFFTIRSMRKTISSLDAMLAFASEVNLIGEVKSAAVNFSAAMGKIDRQVDIIDKEQLFPHLANVTKHIESITRAVDQPESLGAIVSNVQTLSSRLKNLESQIEGTWLTVEKSMNTISEASGHLLVMTENGREMTEDIKGTVKHITSGRGDLGKFIYREDVYLNSRAVMDKMNTTMNDINHFGLLFHLDKGWQRQRTKRMNILNGLQDVDQFRSYFEEEMDQITTSLSRVFTLLEEVKTSSKDEEIEAKFFQGFNDLLRRTEALHDVLNIYNQQILEGE